MFVLPGRDWRKREDVREIYKYGNEIRAFGYWVRPMKVERRFNGGKP